MDTFSAHRSDNGSLSLVPAHTAVLVIDMLNDFCVDGGAMLLPGAERLYGPQNSVIKAVRETGGMVAFVSDQHRINMRGDREFLKREPHCIEGTWGAEVVEALDKQDCDAATGPREQESSLYDIATHFGWVCDSQDVISALCHGSKITGKEFSA